MRWLVFIGVAALGVLLLTGTPFPMGSKAAPAATRTFDIVLGEGKVVVEVGGKDELGGEFHRWEPPVLVAFRGDTIVLNVGNPRKHKHSLVIEAFNIDTGILEPRTGKKTVRFVANKSGVFEYKCGLKHDAAKGWCDPDHKYQVGHLIILER
jgi:hypothetical protein